VVLDVAISPDGRYVAYGFVERGREGLRVRQIDGSATVQVVAPEGGWHREPVRSPCPRRHSSQVVGGR
jgi:hypothetical protein